jgi:integrase
MHADISRGQYIDPRAGKITIAEYSAQWQPHQLHQDSTADMVERAFRLHILPMLGHVPIADARASHIRAWVKATAENLSASTVHLVYSYLKSMFAAGTVDKIIASSPCVGIRLLEIRDREFFIPEPEQIHRLVEEISDRYSPIPYLAAGCGLRGSEIFGLELDQIDFLSREIHVRQQLKRMPGVPPYLGELKTKTSRRTVELPEVVRLALARHVEMYPIREIVIEDRTDTRNIHQRLASSCSSPLMAGHCTARTGRQCGVWRSDVLGCRPASACMVCATISQRS